MTTSSYWSPISLCSVVVLHYLLNASQLRNFSTLMASCTLYEDCDAKVSIMDIPRSIEVGQGVGFSKKLISSAPLKRPYTSVEPKSIKAKAALGKPTLDELLLQKHLEFALDELRCYVGDWCLPRVIEASLSGASKPDRKRKHQNMSYEEREPREDGSLKVERLEPETMLIDTTEAGLIYQNPHPWGIKLNSSHGRSTIYIPPESSIIVGDITATLPLFTSTAPQFSVIILDPPWPNRSARRKQAYNILYNTHEIRALLSSIPIEDHIAKEGYVAIWITNRQAFREMLLCPNGLFSQWGVTLVEEWIWIKVTSQGEPLGPLNGAWRKPYEILLVGRKGGGGQVQRRVLAGVPDLHSRKPNLKSIFDGIIGKKSYTALEIFARNATAGWWAWGNEALKFQGDECWVDREERRSALDITCGRL